MGKDKEDKDEADISYEVSAKYEIRVLLDAEMQDITCFCFEVYVGLEGTPQEHGFRDGDHLPPKLASFLQEVLQREGFTGKVRFVTEEGMDDGEGEEPQYLH